MRTRRDKYRPGFIPLFIAYLLWDLMKAIWVFALLMSLNSFLWFKLCVSFLGLFLMAALYVDSIRIAIRLISRIRIRIVRVPVEEEKSGQGDEDEDE